jgi:sterol desaturase/sphingolipid hydroxylase (fatty acid hydroxylase superfamily)
MSFRPLPPWLFAGVAALQLVGLLILEVRRPLRTASEYKTLRDGRNLIVAATAALPVALIETPIARALTVIAQRRRSGLLRVVRLPLALETLLAVLLLDYTMYLWHRLAHRTSLLWRFHLVHHTDRDMDVTTALRFHAGEMLLSIPYRALQVGLIGVSPLAFSLWQALFTASVLFHHSNLKVPATWEQRLARFIVTPRIHAIHHVANERLQNANWSSGLIVWDIIHGTFANDASSDAARTIGLPAYRSDEDVALTTILTSPFKRQKDAWLT